MYALTNDWPWAGRFPLTDAFQVFRDASGAERVIADPDLHAHGHGVGARIEPFSRSELKLDDVEQAENLIWGVSAKRLTYETTPVLVFGAKEISQREPYDPKEGTE